MCTRGLAFLPLLLSAFALPLSAEEAYRPALSTEEAYRPAPENLAARQWFRDARFGIFIHWGVYSVLGEGEWVMHNNKMSVSAYEPLARQFDPQKFDAARWVKLFKDAGAEYITITSKHHDGFAMWNSSSSHWDIVDRTPYGKDVLKPLADECQRQGLKLFFYHSHLDWHHPDYFPRGRTGQHSERPDQGDFARYLDYMDGQLTELLGGQYGPIAGIWFDGWWDQQKKGLGDANADPHATQIDWRMRQTYDLIHRLQPACLVGNNHHVTPFAGEDFQMFERDLPGENKTGYSVDAQIADLPLESCDTINGSWGYRKDDASHKSVRELVHYLVKAAGRDANLLLNVGPLPDGTIDMVSSERLLGVGEWLDHYASTVKGTRGGPVSPQPWGVTTRREGRVYLHVLDCSSAGEGGWMRLSGTEDLKAAKITFFGGDEPVESKRSDDGLLMVRLPNPEAIDTVLVVR